MRQVGTAGGASAPADAGDSGADPGTRQLTRRARIRDLAGNRTSQNLAALVLYGCLSLAMFGPWILRRMSTWFLSAQSQDGSLFIWALRWWPYAISHHINPLYTTVAWAPGGVNLAWATTLPPPALLLSPVTAIFGPFFSFNVIELAAPALAAWTAYLLCRRITGSAVAALMGGFFFGFSPALIAEVGQGHPNFTLAFLVPLSAYLVVRLLEGSIRPRWFVALLGTVLTVQLYMGPEIFATLTLVGGLSAVIGYTAGPAARRERLRHAIVPTICSYAVACVLASPQLYVAFTRPHITKALTFATVWYGAHRASDLLMYVTPGGYTALWGQLGSRWAGGNPWYLGVPLLALLVVTVITGRRRRSTWALAAGLVVILALSLGDALTVSGAHILPWHLAAGMPLLKVAQPGRLFTYVYLIIAVLVALWLARPSRRLLPRLLRWALVAAAAVMILPNFTQDVWAQEVPVPPFLATGAYRQYISPGEIVWVVETNHASQLIWQAQTGFFFRLAGGFFGGVPSGTPDAVVQERLAIGDVSGASLAQIRAFMASHRVDAVLLADEPAGVPREIAQATGVRGLWQGGVDLFRLGSAIPATVSGRGVH